MRKATRAALAWLSCLIGYCLTRRWQPLCLIVARRWGYECVFCKAIALVMREPHHCQDQMSVPDVIDWLRRKS